jgi:hypothetical protein
MRRCVRCSTRRCETVSNAAAEDALATLHIGDHVADREADTDATMLVVGTPAEAASEYDIDGYTVADANPDHPDDDAVLLVVFPKRRHLDLGDAERYAYPRSRLERVAPVHEEGDDD